MKTGKPARVTQLVKVDPRESIFLYNGKENKLGVPVEIRKLMEFGSGKEVEITVKSTRPVKLEQKEIQGNVAVSISDNEVRLWVCNSDGQNIYRFKALGRVYRTSDGVITIGKI